MLRRAPILLVLLACLASPAFGGTNVRGTLWLSAAERARAGKSATRPKQPGIGEAVVWVAAIPERIESRLAEPRRGWFGLRKVEEPPLPKVAQRLDTFAPRVLAVPAGSSVEFANGDRLYHSTFSVSGARRFDLGKTPPGRRDTLEFRKPGVINLHCEIHPRAVGYVVVTPNRAYATPDSAGRFQLPKLPPGRYVLHAWHPQKGELKLPFDVPKRGVVALDPTF